MTYPPPSSLVRRLCQRVTHDLHEPQPANAKIPVEHYTSQTRFDQEITQVFKQRPLIVGHASQIPDPGNALVFDAMGVPLITLRNNTGEVNTVLNVCRHRGMRLVQECGAHELRSLVCPYHHWTYGLDGDLRNIPRAESFLDVDPANHHLIRLPTEVRHGLIWVQLEGDMNLDKHLAGIDSDLDLFGIEHFHYCAQHERKVNSNWKLIQDAFLDGYHVTRLHKNTVGPFFPDSLAESDSMGEHIRSAVARNEITEGTELTEEEFDLRKLATFSYTVFPNAIIVFHPEYTSILTLMPVSAEETRFSHLMLTPKPPSSDAERDHFARSFTLIDEGVFQSEDIFVCEGAQKGLHSNANSHLLFGSLEEAAIRFHQILAKALEQ